MSRQKKEEFPIILLKNLPFEITGDDIHKLCSKYGEILQIRRGTQPHLKGNCFVIFHEVSSAKKAAELLNGINFRGRYIVSLMYSVSNRSIEDARSFLQKNNGVNSETENIQLYENVEIEAESMLKELI